MRGLTLLQLSSGRRVRSNWCPAHGSAAEAPSAIISAAAARTARDAPASLGNVLTSLDPLHESLELLRGFGAQIRVVHSAQLIGDRKERLGPQANDIVLLLVVGHAHSDRPDSARVPRPRPRGSNAGTGERFRLAACESRLAHGFTAFYTGRSNGSWPAPQQKSRPGS